MLDINHILNSEKNDGSVQDILEEVMLYRGLKSIDREYIIERNKDNRPISTLGNAKSFLMLDDEMFGRFYYDTFSYQYMIIGPIPGEKRDEYFEEIDDTHISKMHMWFVKKGLTSLKENDAYKAMQYACHQVVIHPLHEYFHRLKWDGVSRVNHLMLNGFGAEDCKHSELASKALMLSVAARVLYPGCKVDLMVMLEGEQGVGKSSGCRALLPKVGWFLDHLGDIDNKDTLELLFGTLIVEHAELAGMNKKDSASIKSFLSRQRDRFRRAYALSSKVVKRRPVFIGTTNESNYLSDPTGNRRYVPIVATNVDIKWIVDNRDQLWAEAMERVKGGEPWWFTKEEEASVNEVIKTKLERDVWEGMVLSYCKGMDFVTVEEILKVIKIDQGSHTRGDGTRIGNILRMNGWEHKQLGSGPMRGKRGYVRKE